MRLVLLVEPLRKVVGVLFVHFSRGIKFLNALMMNYIGFPVTIVHAHCLSVNCHISDIIIAHALLLWVTQNAFYEFQ